MIIYSCIVYCYYYESFQTSIVLVLNCVMNAFFSCCPKCRADIQIWTTKKIVQQTLEQQKQQEDDSHDELWKQKEVSLDEEKKHEEVCCEFKSTSNEIFGELCRFDSPNNFLESLRSLHDIKYKLSLIEILLILKSNLAIHSHFFKKFTQYSDIILVFHLVQCTIRYILNKIPTNHQNIHSQRCIDHVITSHCFYSIKSTIEQIGTDSVNSFPDHRNELLAQKSRTVEIIEEMEQLFNI